jgi:hypothetical protein
MGDSLIYRSSQRRQWKRGADRMRRGFEQSVVDTRPDVATRSVLKCFADEAVPGSQAEVTLLTLKLSNLDIRPFSSSPVGKSTSLLAPAPSTTTVLLLTTLSS